MDLGASQAHSRPVVSLMEASLSVGCWDDYRGKGGPVSQR